jgi:two-component system chemotaxis response regulator CheB
LHNIVKKIEAVVKRNVIEASGAEEFELGNIYVLRSGRNYKLVVKNGRLFLRGFKERLGLGYRPSINLVMENFSAVFGGRCTGIVLSGYGNDGVLGSKLIIMRGGKIIVQDPETAEIPLMPRFVKEMIDSLGEECEIIKLLLRVYHASRTSHKLEK